MTIVSVHHNPFTPIRDFEKKVVLSGMRIADLAPITNKPFICFLNGEVLLRKDWVIRTRRDDVVNFVILRQGGGSNPLRIEMMVAVIALAAWAKAALIRAAYSVALAGTASAAVGLVGSA